MEKHYDAAGVQPLPTHGQVDVAVEAAEELRVRGLHEIAEDIEARILLGERKYGSRLKTHNGRDALLDLMQECLDSINYAKQVQLEGLDTGGLFEKAVEITVLVKQKIDERGTF